MASSIVWTAIPNGFENGKLRVTVVASFRLQPASTVQLGAGFPAIYNWDALKFGFKVAIASGGFSAGGDVVPEPDFIKENWKKLFKSSVPVKGFAYKPTASRILESYSVRHVHTFVKDVYGGLTKNFSAGFPGIRDMAVGPYKDADVYRPVAGATGVSASALREQQHPKVNQEKLKQGASKYDAVETPYKAAMRAAYKSKAQAWRNTGGAAPDAATLWHEAREFYEPYETAGFKPVEPDFDFHQAVAMASEHPELMRTLGLTFDLLLDVPAGMPTFGTISATPTFAVAGVTHAPVKTRYEFVKGEVFLPAHKQKGLNARGFMNVSSDLVDVLQVDIDGSAIKQLDFASNLRQMLVRATKASDQNTPPPSLRTGGLALSQHKRTFALKQRFTDSDKNNTDLSDPTKVELYYEDLARGYRADVKLGSDWRSLCLRQGTYTLGGSANVDAKEESWIGTSATSDPKNPSGPAKVHEMLFRWDGWSLVCERPGKWIGPDDKLMDEGDHGADKVDKNFDLRMQFSPVPGSLPPLRFGKSYQMRVRLATVAGTGPTQEDKAPGAAYETEPTLFRRWEPVASPSLFELNPPKPGERGESTNHVVIRKYVANPTKINPSQRQIVPPSSDVSLCEFHGRFDSGGKPDPNLYKLIRDRELMPELPQFNPAKIDKLPYLADPLALGVCVQNAPQVAVPLMAKFPNAWPEQKSLQMTVKAANGPSTISSDTFTFNLRPGEIVRPKFSSIMPPEGPELFGMTDWARAKGGLNEAEYKNVVSAGLNWMITPARPVTLVFATQVPEIKADLDEVRLARGPGQTSCQVFGQLKTHSWTTEEVEFVANWTDDVDYLEETKRATKTVDKQHMAFRVKIARGENSPVTVQKIQEREEFHDTKHHRLAYTMNAITPFKAYFPAEWDGDTDPDHRFIETSKYTRRVEIPSSRRPDPPSVEYIVPAFGWNTALSADKATKTSTRVANMLRVYLRRPWYSSGNDEKLAVILLQRPTGPVTMVATPSDAALAITTRFGADPVYTSGDVFPTPLPTHFEDADDPRTGLQTEELSQALQVTAVPYDVAFDDDRQMWYADIQINAGRSAYMPFVRLALARYQPYSIANLHLSRIVVADIMQLQMNRVATLTFLDATQKVRVQVTGVLGGAIGTNKVYGTLEEKTGPDDDTGWKPVLVDGKELMIEVPLKEPELNFRIPSIRRRPPIRGGGGGGEEPTDFLAAEEPQERQVRQGTNQVRVDPNQIRANPNLQVADQPGTFPLPKPRTSTQYRIVLKEYEFFNSDTGEPSPPTAGGRPSPPIAMASQVLRLAARVVYADVIPLA